ncbi:MAG: nitroreductase family protein [Treponema sp.]|nr:nitroreductase family protein [Treponema sp.]
MKKIVTFALLAMILFLGGQPVSAQNSGALALIIDHYAARNFLEGAIPAADLDRIIQAGVRAPSARNLQPWHFTVIQNQTLAKKLVSNNLDGNVIIVVSGPGDGKTNYVQILDCALAVQSIYLAAQALGYGSRIYTNPIDSLNNSMKTELSLPAGYSAVALIRVGKIQGGVDAVSSASSRKKVEDVVTYKR